VVLISSLHLFALSNAHAAELFVFCVNAVCGIWNGMQMNYQEVGEAGISEVITEKGAIKK